MSWRDCWFACVVAVLTTAFLLNALRLGAGDGWAAILMTFDAVFLLANLTLWLRDES